MPIEVCVNCGRRIDWGPAFAKQEGKDHRKCYFCKKSFDVFDVVNDDGTIDLTSFMGKRSKKR